MLYGIADKSTGSGIRYPVQVARCVVKATLFTSLRFNFLSFNICELGLIKTAEAEGHNIYEVFSILLCI